MRRFPIFSSTNIGFIWIVVLTACRPLGVTRDAAFVRSLGGTVEFERTRDRDSDAIVGVNLSRGFYAPVLCDGWGIHGESGDSRPTIEVCDDDIWKLKDLSRLRRLKLGGTRITGKALSRLTDCKELTELDLSGTNINDNDLMMLQKLTSLTELHLAGTNVTDGGLIHLGHLANLRVLSLDNTVVSDNGLRVLAAFKVLRRVNLRDTRVTADGVDETHETRPDLRLELDRYSSGFVI
jgi:hypothetical protein